MKAVHFGAGNIGRGFVGWLLHEGGYDLVFSDVAAPLVDAINAVDSYTVFEVGPGGVDRTVTGFRAVNSATDPETVASEVATADVVTCAVGPTILRFIAPAIVAGLKQRDPARDALHVMACENAIGATDQLRDEIAALAGEEAGELLSRAVFANTAVDRIVPAQPANNGVNVTVEPYFEWAIESAPFGGRRPQIPGAHFVDDLTPYIERKLYTVNTGHASTAYFGAAAGIERISDALAEPTIATRVGAVLAETSAMLHAVHGLEESELATYRETILARFRNPALVDTVNRVGRQPIRKLSRNDRFIGPAAQAAERGLSTDALLSAVSVALAFHDPQDEQSVRLQEMLRTTPAAELVTTITGLDSEHPLYAGLLEVFAARQSA